MKLESFKEKVVYFIILLNGGFDWRGSGSSKERGKGRYILASEKNTNSLQPPSDQLILIEYLPRNPLSQVTEFKKWFMWFLTLTST